MLTKLKGTNAHAILDDTESYLKLHRPQFNPFTAAASTRFVIIRSLKAILSGDDQDPKLIKIIEIME